MNVDYRDGTSEVFRNQTANQVEDMTKRLTDPDGDVARIEIYREQGKYVDGPFVSNRKDRRAAASSGRRKRK